MKSALAGSTAHRRTGFHACAETEGSASRCVHMEAIVDVTPDVALAPVPEAPQMQLASVSKAWDDRVVLDRVDLALAPGTLTWLTGENGAGKTTVLRIAAGLLAPDGGRVSLGGLHPLRDRRGYRRRLGFLSAGDRGIYARLSVHHHLQLCARMALMPVDTVDLAIARIVNQLDLDPFVSQRADRISMGQRQRLRIAMTFLHSPDVVLLDEPLTSLDGAGAERLRSCIDGVLQRSGSVLWCSPGVEADQLGADRRLVVGQGKVLEAG
jgi:ABC-2 type transport system ATP-binding protein